MTFNCKDLKPGDVCVMRNGDEATFLAFNPFDKYLPHVFAPPGGGVICHREDGRFCRDGREDSWDIIRKKPEKITKWVNLHGDGDAVVFDTREEADERGAPHYDRIACKQITFEEGEGL